MAYSHQFLVTFVGALFFGVLLIAVSNKLRVPAIVLLLLGGIGLGPVGLGILQPQSLGNGLTSIIQLAVALILFEGGLTLDAKGYRQVSREIRSSLTRGVLTTWLVTAVVVKFLFDFSWPFSILAGSLVIVTGPTVIGPLLKRVRVNSKLHNFLHWEGVLIDPIGVFIALLCYEWIIGYNAFALFGMRIATGIVIGFAGGFLLWGLLKKKLIPDDILNVFTLSYALAIYVASDLIMAESGLLSVTIAGFFIGYADTPQIDEIKVYKAQLIDLLIALLFMLLAANLDITRYASQYGWKMILAVGIVMVGVRPLNIFITTIDSQFNWREKLFLSWIAPRGIVAASMASLFALNLKGLNDPAYSANYTFLEAFTYAVICGTVFIQGFTAPIIGKWLRVVEPVPTGWLVVGAHNLGRTIAGFIKDLGYSVTLIDTNLHAVKVARRAGFNAIIGDALTLDHDDHPELYDVGNVLAVTANEDLNQLLCQQWAKNMKNVNLYEWHSEARMGERSDDDSLLKGKPVWTQIQLNKVTAMNIEGRDLVLSVRHDSPQQVRHQERVLMCQHNGSVMPYLPDTDKGECLCLTYHPVAMKAELNLRLKWILYVDATDMEEVMKQLLEAARADYPSIKIAPLLKKLIEQEEVFPSVIGYNVALPHSYIDGIDESLVLFAKVKKAITSIGGEDEIHYIFLVLSPKGRPNTHIETLATISKFISEDETRSGLEKATSKKDLRKIFYPDVEA
jgi:NhaP-type Na+/H+ or K+/H+ antiporter/mannitol/fructose-specific phosphotransferase system IIA component (Ntr-type)